MVNTLNVYLFYISLCFGPMIILYTIITEINNVNAYIKLSAHNIQKNYTGVPLISVICTS